jgi:hypothetical protein
MAELRDMYREVYVYSIPPPDKRSENTAVAETEHDCIQWN